MRNRWTLMIVLAAALGGWLSRDAFSDEEPEGPAGAADMEKMMKELATPGEMHAWLARAAGEWQVETEGMLPDGTMEKGKATASIRMVLGGRFQEQVLRGTFHGEAFEGRGLTGYDNLTKAFQNYWFDTMGTAPSIAKGQLSEDGKTLDLAGTWDMPGMSMPFRFVHTWNDENCMTFTMFGTMEGQEMTMMRARYTRAQ